LTPTCKKPGWGKGLKGPPQGAKEYEKPWAPKDTTRVMKTRTRVQLPETKSPFSPQVGPKANTPGKSPKKLRKKFRRPPKCCPD